jgi:hypothetical protein
MEDRPATSETFTPVTIQMLRAGVLVLEKFNPEIDEVTNLVAEIYWAMEAVRPPQR